jgi:two-component system, cell cycle sensor histidine kinase DivJ
MFNVKSSDASVFLSKLLAERIAAPMARIARGWAGDGSPADAVADPGRDADGAGSACTMPDRRTLDLMPGLVTLHDARGHVLSLGCLDAAEFDCWMRPAAGRGFLDQIHISDRLAFLQALDLLRQGEARQTVTLRLTRRAVFGEGEQFTHVTCDMTALRDGAGAMTGILVQTRIADEAVQARRELAEMSRSVARAEAEKTRFLAAVSHEMRTPLNAIIGFSEILTREYFGALPDPRQREYVGLIRQSGDHLLGLVNAMLDMSKIEAGRYQLLGESFEVGDVVGEVTSMLALQAEEKGLGLTARVTRNCGTLTADSRAVRQILINLVGNAIKFTEPGGVITVDAERRGEAVRLCVADTGIGMGASVIDRLGQPFVQADGDYARSHQGTGLGLCLVKGLVELHGGTFRIDSTPGQGTVVRIDLPADGSGIMTGAAQGTASRPGSRAIEFPPRLKTMEQTPRDEEEEHDAPAKTA